MIFELPKDWKSESLRSVSKVSIGLVTTMTEHYTDSGIPLIRNSDIKENRITKDKLIKLKISFAQQYPSRMLNQGDIVTVHTGEVGVSAVIDDELAGCLGFATLNTRPNSSIIDSNYLCWYFNSDRFLAHCVSLSTGDGRQNLNLKDFAKVRIPIPPLVEQKKLAQILSTWDQAIATTERLLDLSRQQKKALMQQLLTGKKRFPGFEGEWKKCTLGELGDTFNGLTGKTKDDFGFGKKYIPYINIFKNSRIDVNALELVDVKEGESQSLSQYGDIFFTTSSETPDEVGMSSVLLDHVDELYLNSFCFGYRLFGFESLQPEFARYLLRSENVRGEIAVLGQGATRYNLSKKQLMKLELTLPPVDEQKKIASVLSGADQEIETLQSQLDGLKQEKKALMQVLLTGKRRVQLN